MELFATQLAGVMSALTTIFLVLGRISRTKLVKLEGTVTAGYSTQMKWLSLFGYCFIAIFPLIMASSLTEGDAMTDRITFLGIHALFFLMTLWTFNRSIVVGRDKIGSSNMLGGVRIISHSEMASAICARSLIPVRATAFVSAGYKISVDDDMQNCTGVVDALKKIVRQAGAQ